MLKNKPPITAPYTLLFSGLDVIIHVPLAQPTKYQYANPPIAPNTTPNITSLFFSKTCFIYLFCIVNTGNAILSIFFCTHTEDGIQRTKTNKAS